MKVHFKTISTLLPRPILIMVLAIALAGGIGGIVLAQMQKQPIATAVKTTAPTAKRPVSKPTPEKLTATHMPAALAPSATPALSVPSSPPPATECNQTAKTRYDNDIYYPAVDAEVRRHGPARVVPLTDEPLTPEQKSAQEAQAAADEAEQRRHFAALENLGDVRAQYMRSINCPLGR